jgi:hypothetical protein
MSSSRSTGMLAFSILLESARDASPPGAAASSLVARLLQVFARHDIPATWLLRQPWQSPVARSVLRGGTNHELGMVGDPDWGDWGRPLPGKARLPLELSRRLGLAREAGISIASVALPGVSGSGWHAGAQVLAAAGVQAVWSPAADLGSSTSRPVPIGDRVWHIPGTLEITPPGSWLAVARQRSQWRRTWQPALASRHVTHVWADASTLHDSAGVASLEAAVRAAASLRSQTGLRIAPLGEIAETLEAKPRAAQAHSILRAA